MDMYREEYEAKRKYLIEWSQGVLAMEITDNPWLNALIIAHCQECSEAQLMFSHVYQSR